MYSGPNESYDLALRMTSSLQVITLDMGLLVAGTKYRGEFEERLKKLMEEIKQNDDIILVSTFSCRSACNMLCNEPPAFYRSMVLAT